MLSVHVRINDASGKPTPVRLRLLQAGGEYRAPLGRLARFATGDGQDVGGNALLGSEAFAYVEGACEVLLSPGPVLVEAHKGPEFTPLRREVVLAPGKLALRLAIERWIDLRPEGWFAGDVRAHELSPHAALLEGAAEGLAVVNVLARERAPGADAPAALPDLLAFSGTAPALASPDCLVVVNTLNAHPVLGTFALLNCHRVVHPLRFGAPDHLDHWSVADWCDQCHRKAGLVVWPDLPRMKEGALQGEALACLLLGKVDAYEVSSFADVEGAFANYYRLLDCGLRVPLAGGSGKSSNRTALGAVRTYARLGAGQSLAYAPWIEAVRAGKTFITSAPLLTLQVEGEGPGAVLARSAGEAVRVRAEARSAVPFERLELLVGGTVVGSTAGSGDGLACALELELTVTGSTWLAARCRSAEGGSFAHTSPVYVRVEGQPPRPAAEARGPLLAVLDQTAGWVETAARCENDRQRQHLLDTLGAARAELLRLAKREGP